MVLGGVALAVYALVTGTGDTAQWVGYGVGIYSVFSWIQMLKFTDPPTYRLIWGSKTVLLAIFGFGSLSFFTYGYMFWVAPYGIRRSEEHTSELQSLMRISYAVFCLNKKHNTAPHKDYDNNT